MSSNNTNTKTGATPTAPFPSTTPFPSTNGSGPSKDSILNDLRRQLDDSDISSNAGSNSSGRRRRRRNRNKNQSALGQTLANNQAPTVLPRLSETKPVRLQLGLNLDVELELKARIVGDVSLTLLQ